jgi:hypothetical protein
VSDAPPLGATSTEVIGKLRQLGRLRTPVDTGGQKPEGERCDLCGTSIPSDHRHLLHLEQRRIVCACEPCRAMRASEEGYRPTGTRVQPLPEFELSDELWAQFQIPIGLAFFFFSAPVGGVVALYPSPAGATESELYLAAWEELVAANPVLRTMEPDVEALIVNRMSDQPGYAIVPIDHCYELVGMIKAGWEGISGGSAVQDSVDAFFARMQPSGASV